MLGADCCSFFVVPSIFSLLSSSRCDERSDRKASSLFTFMFDERSITPKGAITKSCFSCRRPTVRTILNGINQYEFQTYLECTLFALIWVTVSGKMCAVLSCESPGVGPQDLFLFSILATTENTYAYIEGRGSAPRTPHWCDSLVVYVVQSLRRKI